MQVWLNDELIELEENTTVSNALSQWSHVQGTFALALNQAFVPKGAYENTFINEGDRIAIITPMQGG